MTCKRSEQCDHADLCQFAKSTEYNLLGGSCFTLKDPQTNEEWLKHCNTEQLAEFLYDIAYFDNWSDAIMNDSLINETAVEDAIEKWLKQPHTTKE